MKVFTLILFEIVGDLIVDIPSSNLLPSRIEEFKVGMRFDAADYRGHWFSGNNL